MTLPRVLFAAEPSVEDFRRPVREIEQLLRGEIDRLDRQVEKEVTGLARSAAREIADQVESDNLSDFGREFDRRMIESADEVISSFEEDFDRQMVIAQQRNVDLGRKVTLGQAAFQGVSLDTSSFFVGTAPENIEALASLRVDLVKRVGDDARQLIRTALVRGQIAGRTFDQIEKEILEGEIDRRAKRLRRLRGTLAANARGEIRRRVARTWAARAERIARTESMRAMSVANEIQNRRLQDSLGRTIRKRWVAILDARTRASHAAANGRTVNIDEKFLVGSARLTMPHDPSAPAAEVVNCRCTHVTIF